MDFCFNQIIRLNLAGVTNNSNEWRVQAHQSQAVIPAIKLFVFTPTYPVSRQTQQCTTLATCEVEHYHKTISMTNWFSFYLKIIFCKFFTNLPFELRYTRRVTTASSSSPCSTSPSTPDRWYRASSRPSSAPTSTATRTRPVPSSKSVSLSPSVSLGRSWWLLWVSLYSVDNIRT